MIAYPKKLLPSSDDNTSSPGSSEFIQIVDNNLATAWKVMRRFCLLVNLSTQTQRLMNAEIIHETMVSVMYRLLHMRFANDSIDEAVRLGLLAFSHHVFLQWHDVRLPYSHFPNAYQCCMVELLLAEEAPSQLMLWLLMTGATSIFNTSDEAWLKESLRYHIDGCQAKTWKEVREILKLFMWIELLDDHPGKRIFDLLHLDMNTKGNRTMR